MVEDDPKVREVLLNQLSSLGYAVTAVESGQAAVERLKSGAAFELMLTDVVMPGISGPSLAAEVKQTWPGIKVLFMSGYSKNAAVAHGRVPPGIRILSKPFRKIDLATRVREELDGA